jgi:DNA invertase Pin-like site-specific DNA recombinase
MATDSHIPVRAGIYCRISIAAIGDTTKTDDQERICRDLAARLGWEVTDIYSDPNQSAWQANRKRKQWDRMLADVETGRINAIVTYHGDRLVRRHEDLSDLLRLAKLKGVKLASPTGTRDLDSDDDQFVLEIEASMAKRESANTSRRRKMLYARMRREGYSRPGGKGGRAFCFERDGVTHRPREAAIIRRAARAVLRGHSLGSVCAGLRAQGVLSTAGKPMSQNTLRRILLSPRTAGLMPDGISPAAWKPVLDRETWEMVCAVLAAHKANPRAGRGALHLLSGIAVCGECGHALWAGHNGTKPGVVAYKCPRRGCHKVGRNAELLDAYVGARTVGRLNHPANPEAEVQLHDGAGAELAALTTRRAETEAFIASLADHPGHNIEVLSRALKSFDTKITAIRDQMAGDSAGRLRTRYTGLTVEEFGGLPLDVRRALVRSCYQVTVLRSSGRGPGFREQDVVLSPVTGGQ